jgi:hypothetical protein
MLHEIPPLGAMWPATPAVQCVHDQMRQFVSDRLAQQRGVGNDNRIELDPKRLRGTAPEAAA